MGRRKANGFYTDKKGRKRPITKKVRPPKIKQGLTDSEVLFLFSEMRELTDRKYKEKLAKEWRESDPGESDYWYKKQVELTLSEKQDRVLDTLDTAAQTSKGYDKESFVRAHEEWRKGDWAEAHDHVRAVYARRLGKDTVMAKGKVQVRIVKEGSSYVFATIDKTAGDTPAKMKLSYAKMGWKQGTETVADLWNVGFREVE